MTEDATLFVPMRLDALVITESINNLPIAYNRWQMDYGQMNRFLNPMPEGFIDQKTEKPRPGVYLHWTLPEGLAHGVEKENGHIEFPFAPNRWLVVRIQSGREGSGPTAQSWVVIADAYCRKGTDHPDCQDCPEDCKGCTSPFLDPYRSRDGHIEPARLGRKVALAEWDPDKDQNGAPFLRAVAPGNVAFAAFAPGVENVFAFYDDLTDVDASKLTYLVVGWYSRPAEMDPLTFDLPRDAWVDKFLFNISPTFQAELDQGYLSDVLRQVFKDFGCELPGDPRVFKDGAAWRITDDETSYTARQEKDSQAKDVINVYDSTLTVMENLRWAVKLQGNPPPTRTLLHGLVYDVNLKPNLQDLKKLMKLPWREELGENVRIAVGNTSMDALSALIHSQAQSAGKEVDTEILEALQYDLLSTLDQVGSKTLLDQEIRKDWFGSEPGGTRWTLVAAERGDDQPNQEPPDVEPYAAVLAKLNQAQRRLDAEERILASLQWELYALWWKSNRFQSEEEARRGSPPDLEQNLARELQAQVSRVIAQKSKIDQLAQEVAAARDNLHLDPSLVLKPIEMPRFWRPNDPVILISGLRRPLKQGQDGNLLCRLASDTVKGIMVSSLLNMIPLSADDFKTFLPRLPDAHLPAAVAELLTEAFFLDPGNADTIAASSSFPVNPGAVEQAIKDLKQAHPAGTSVIGACGALEWEQPWSPLFLDWQVNYYYTFEQASNGSFLTDQGNYVFARQAWQFDGTDGRWQAPLPSPGSIFTRTYTGRTFLTPHAPLTFLDRLRKYIGGQPDADPQVDALLESISNWDILSQTLSGFSDQLILRDLGYTIPPNGRVEPFGDISEYVQDQYQSMPYMNLVSGGAPFFFPLRAGWLKFEALRIIDRFGRTVNLLYGNNNPDLNGSKDAFVPIRGRGMIPRRGGDDGDGLKGLVELPPRVVQASRMSLRFVSAAGEAGDKKETDLEVDSNPVCGWLLPNHIDQSISVYDAGGELLGELSLLNERIYAQPAPGTIQQAEMVIANPHLNRMLRALRDRPDQAEAYRNLLQVIDESLWTIDPAGQRDDQNLSVLIGRPLAVVRANLQLELSGHPFYNQAWAESFSRNSGGLLELDFPVRLGSQELRSDGLIGYFQQGLGARETDYSVFHTVHYPKSLYASPYLVKIGDKDDYVRCKFKPTTADLFDTANSVYLTMLLDPRGVVHATSGLLPTKVVELPERYVGKALKRMAVTFRSGPLLCEQGTVRLPLPAEQHGTWSWIARGTHAGEWEMLPIAKPEATARFSNSLLKLVEGWLKFKPEP